MLGTGRPRRHLRRRLLAPLLLCLLAVGGCGNARTRPPSLSQAALPNGFHTLSLPAAGLTLRVPSDWAIVAGHRPLIATISSGPAVVALWRYERGGVPPQGPALRQAAQRLLAAARARDRRLSLIRSRLLVLDHAPAIEIDAFELIAGMQRRVRSTHVFEPGSEVVLDEYAPVSSFHLVDHFVFSPLKRSLLVAAVRTGTAARSG